MFTFVSTGSTRRRAFSTRSPNQNTQLAQNPMHFTTSTCGWKLPAPIRWVARHFLPTFPGADLLCFSRTRFQISSNHGEGGRQFGSKRQAERQRKAGIRPLKGSSSLGVTGPNRSRPHFKETLTRWIIFTTIPQLTKTPNSGSQRSTAWVCPTKVALSSTGLEPRGCFGAPRKPDPQKKEGHCRALSLYNLNPFFNWCPSHQSDHNSPCLRCKVERHLDLKSVQDLLLSHTHWWEFAKLWFWLSTFISQVNLLFLLRLPSS